MSVSLRVVILLSVVFLPSCTKLQFEYQADAFNRAAAVASSNQLLLNAVRASLDLPMRFTATQTFIGNDNISGSFSPKLPFGGDAMRLFDLGATVNWGPGFHTINYTDVGLSKANKNLNKHIEYHVFDAFVRAGIDPGILQTILTEFYEIHADLYDQIKRRREFVCLNPTPDQMPRCEFLEQVRRDCQRNKDDDGTIKYVLEKNEEFRTIINNPTEQCRYSQFQAFLVQLRLVGMAQDLVQTSTVVYKKDKDGNIIYDEKRNPVTAVETGTAFKIYFQNRMLQRKFDQIQERLLRKNLAGHRVPIKIGLRSPKSLVSYLGQLIALQNRQDHKRLVPYYLSGAKQVPIFRVVRDGLGDVSEISHAKRALSIEGPDGYRYWVPEPAYGVPFRDRTLQVLSITNELLNAAISEEDLPVPAVILSQ